MPKHWPCLCRLRRSAAEVVAVVVFVKGQKLSIADAPQQSFEWLLHFEASSASYARNSAITVVKTAELSYFLTDVNGATQLPRALAFG